MRLIDRLLAVWRTRGIVGFARFVASRILTCRRDIVFGAQTIGELHWSAPESIVCIGPENVDRDLGRGLVAQLSHGEGAAYLEGLSDGDLLLAVVDDAGRVLHHSFILFATRTKAVLAEQTATPLFAHCATLPEARGRKLYPQTLRYGLGVLAQRGHARAVINCDPANVASIKGIERAGFHLLREVTTWTVGSWLGFQFGRDGNNKRLVRAYFG